MYNTDISGLTVKDKVIGERAKIDVGEEMRRRPSVQYWRVNRRPAVFRCAIKRSGVASPAPTGSCDGWSSRARWA